MEIITTPGLLDYARAVAEMEARVAAIRTGEKPETLWLVEHPPLYTAGTSAKAHDVLNAAFPVYQTGRGGQLTYHGPGQRVAYVMLDLMARGGDIRQFVWQLEETIIRTLAAFDVMGWRIAGRVGIWVGPEAFPSKIAAIGVRVRSGVTYHGLSLNVAPDLSHFNGIVPCGIADAGVTSLQALGENVSMHEVDAALVAAFETVFSLPQEKAA